MGSVRVLRAPAKVNLHLEILGRRGDGFHEILSVFQAVSLYDRVTIRSLKVTGQLSVRCTLPIPAEQNIVTAAVRRFRERTGIEAGVAVSVRKAIPVGAGLGGGSSDAAATLRGLNQMFGRPLGRSELTELATGLGSDVPFFLGGPAALVEGRGERLTSLPGRADYEVVLVWPGFGVATREAYEWFDEQGQSAGAPAHLSAQEIRRRFADWQPRRWGFYNSFREVVEARHPVLAEIVRDLAEAGAEAAGLSGSGSSVFGLFAGAGPARAAAAGVRRRYPFVEVVSPLQIRGTQD